ncbi:MAG: hypothetical protein JW932_15075 [Deltaproteobacteria bacterium]|nr:hypothetical protein [Deltaproteobacteria bacterium]
MMDWSEPKNLSEWAKRLFAPRPLVFILLISFVLISEFRFDWIERAIGAYLFTTNAKRPESGVIWEIGHRTSTARQTLDHLVADRLSQQREARGATSITQIASNLPSGQGVMLSADQFKKLYLNLPQTIAQEIISPFTLIQIFSRGDWIRTYIEKEDLGLKVYFLNAETRVFQELRIPSRLLSQINKTEMALDGTLEDFPSFLDRIYTADRFFKAMESLSEEDRRSVISHPDRLLSEQGRIVRIGISDEVVSGYIELGFEIEEGTGRKVIVMRSPEWAVWILRSQLEERRLFSEPMDNYP